jgi:hypothetical protein
VTFAGALTGYNWRLDYQEMSSIGQSNNPSSPTFWQDAIKNAGRAGLAGGTAGASEIIIGTYNFSQDGDADALTQHMGGVAGANLLVAGGIKGGNAVRSTLRKPQAVIPEANLKPSVATETTASNAVESLPQRVSQPGKISGNPQNRLIETGKPLKNGNGWVKRYITISEAEELKMRQDIFEHYNTINEYGKSLGIPESEMHEFRFNEMQKFRTQWLKDFFDARNAKN